MTVGLALDLDPELGAGLSAHEWEALREACRGEVVRVPRGPWAPPAHDDDSLGLVIVEGLLCRETALSGHQIVELLGPADILKLPAASDRPRLSTSAVLTAVTETVLLSLGESFAGAAARRPALMTTVHQRLEAQREQIVLQALIAKMPRAEHRVLLALWHLGDRFGRVRPSGIEVPLPLTFSLIGQLVAVRRSTAMLAVKRLEYGGQLQRLDDGSWLLTPGAARVVAAISRSRATPGMLVDSLVARQQATQSRVEAHAIRAHSRHLRAADGRAATLPTGHAPVNEPDRVWSAPAGWAAPVRLRVAVAELGRRALERADLDDLLTGAVRMVAELTGAQAAEVLTAGAGHDGLRERAVWPQGDGAKSVCERHRADPAIRALADGWSKCTAQPDPAPGCGDRSAAFAAAAIRPRGGQPWGVLVAHGVEPPRHDRVRGWFLSAVADVLADAIERLKIEEAMRHQALHDDLTGLPNRSLFFDRLEQAARAATRTGQPVSVLFLDLDHFKHINDSLGHQAGDTLLNEVATRMRRLIRPLDTVARLGGDEFAVLAVAADGAAALDIAERLVAVIAAPFALGGAQQVVTASVGVATRCAPDVSPDALVSDADAAMYRAKELGRGRVEIFDQRLRDRAQARVDSSRQLRRALEQDELHVHYQPIVSLATRAVVGAEALARWQHPDRGLLAADRFVPTAEETGLIVPIGRRLMREAIRTAAAWHKSVPGFRVSINLSARELRQRDFADFAAQALRDSGCPGAAIAMEITEAMLRDLGETERQALHTLRSLGVKVVLDDFGSGYSPLTYLRSLPIDVLKIPAALICDGERDSVGRAVAESIRMIAVALNLSVVCERVETERDHDALGVARYELAQGFLYGAAAPDSQIPLELAH